MGIEESFGDNNMRFEMKYVDIFLKIVIVAAVVFIAYQAYEAKKTFQMIEAYSEIVASEAFETKKMLTTTATGVANETRQTGLMVRDFIDRSFERRAEGFKAEGNMEEEEESSGY